MNTPKKIHYTYKITNLNPTDERLYYIGVRSTSKASAELDTSYQSSSNYLKEAMKEIGHTNFKKEILSTWETRKMAELEETKLHRLHNVIKNPLFYNLAIGNAFDGQCNTGIVDCFDKLENTQVRIPSELYQKNKDRYTYHQTNHFNAFYTVTKEYKKVSLDEFYENNDLVSDHKNKVVATNILTQKNELICSKDFYEKDMYIGVNSGNVSAKNKQGQITSVTKNEFDKNDLLVGIAKNTVVVENINTGERKRVDSNNYDKAKWTTKLKGRRTGKSINTAIKIHIFNGENKLMFETHGNFKQVCELHGLPYGAFQKSYTHNVSLYDNLIHKGAITILKNKDFYKFKGWYALKISK